MGMLTYLTMENRINDLADRVAVVHERSQLRLMGDIAAVNEEVASLQQDVEKLALFTRSPTTLLVDKGVITHAELADRVVEIDHEDGLEDGRCGAGPGENPS